MPDDKWFALTTVDASERSLHVYGAVQAPHPGYGAVLEPSLYQLAGPITLVMKLSLQQLPGEWPKRSTLIPVAYEDQFYRGQHRSVKILSGGNLVAEFDIQSIPSRTGALV